MTRPARNILFIMFDQLRFDYLSCAGHPALETPHMDALAARGVRFTRAYVQSPICGPSRMSFYTGRYVHSHGAAWNNFPLKVGEVTLGDHLRARGMDAVLIGKTHMKADDAGLERLGIARDGIIGTRVSECGFDAYVRDDGLWAEGPDGPYDAKPSPYNAFLRERGYSGRNPWHDHANSALSEGGEIASGWLMHHAGEPANVRETDSETPWLTDRAIDFLEERRATRRKIPWLCHLSYIKPHWPYIVPAPYHALYGPGDVQPAIRDPREREDPHPVFAAFQRTLVARNFSRDEVREKVIPAYMGLVKQCDDQIGRLMAYLRDSGQLDDTLIVLTSDHGDYLGDHWLGEKDLFHEPSVKVPLIVCDPSRQADATRGTTCDALVEAIDLAATFVDMAGGAFPGHILEGRSLRPFLHGAPPADWRAFAVSEYDYSCTPMAGELGVAPKDARLFMVTDRRWKLIEAEGGFRPMLFDLQADPQEFTDLGASPDHAQIVATMRDHLARWARRESQRTTLSDAAILARRSGGGNTGVLIGAYDEADVSPADMTAYRGTAVPISEPDPAEEAGGS
ncbi:sulfatase-like hydrolase/transferase [Stappia taiwanensis]|nr:sulfatase-like hydrolase/transferase [Stappia taiwanensis]